jgi:outer membrane lipoprotein-sorting protein
MQRKSVLLMIAALLMAPLLAAQTVDDIIAKNAQARGGLDKLKAVQSVRATGTMTVGPGMEAPMTLIQKRPHQMRIEFTIQGLTGVEGFDGVNAWQIMPFNGKKDPEAMSADETKEIEDQADIDGPLVDYKAKGHKVELLGKDKAEGTDVYKLKVTLKNGDVVTMFLDADSFLEIKSEVKRMVRGSEVEAEVAIGDYKEVSGLMVPFSIEAGQKGSEQKQKITITKYEINAPVDDSLFKMPAAPAAPAAKPEPAKDTTETKKP